VETRRIYGASVTYHSLKIDLTLSLYCPDHIPATVAGTVTGIAPMETVALTYKELADRLAIKVESARKTAQRKRWHRTTGNDGTIRIHVPLDALPSAAGQEDSHGDSPNNPVHVQLAKLEAEITGLKEVLQAERNRTAAAEQDRDAWREQAQTLAKAKTQEPQGLLAKLFRKTA